MKGVQDITVFEGKKKKRKMLKMQLVSLQFRQKHLIKKRKRKRAFQHTHSFNQLIKRGGHALSLLSRVTHDEQKKLIFFEHRKNLFFFFFFFFLRPLIFAGGF